MKKFRFNLTSIAAQVDTGQIRQIEEAINRLQPDWLLPGDINLKFVDDDESRALNSKYSGNDYATDVLSFSYIEDGSEPVEGELGDIAISLETTRKQAAEKGISLDQEIAALVVHGTIHIFGFDHASVDQKHQMAAQEEAIMRAVAAGQEK